MYVCVGLPIPFAVLSAVLSYQNSDNNQEDEDRLA